MAQPGRGKTGCAVVGVFDSRKLSKSAADLDEQSQGHVSHVLKRGDMQGKSGTTLLLHNVPNVAAERVLLVGLGREAEFGAKQYREAIASANVYPDANTITFDLGAGPHTITLSSTLPSIRSERIGLPVARACSLAASRSVYQ